MSVSKLWKLYEGLMHVPHCGKYARKRVLIDLIFPHKGRILDFALLQESAITENPYSHTFYAVLFSVFIYQLRVGELW